MNTQTPPASAPLPSEYVRATYIAAKGGHRIYVVDGWLCIDSVVTQPMRLNPLGRQTSPWHRTGDVRLEDVASIKIEGISVEHARGVSKAGLISFLTGLWNSGKRVGATTDVLVTTKAGRWFNAPTAAVVDANVLMVTHQAPALAVKAMWSPVMAALS